MKKIPLVAGRVLLACISLPALSRLWGRIMRLRRPRFLVRSMIRRFQKHYRISMDEYQGELADYHSLCEFFLRPLDPVKRPLPLDSEFLLAPADGRLSELELLSSDQATQVKGWAYPVSRLLADRPRFLAEMVSGDHLPVAQQLPSLPLPSFGPRQRLLSRRHAPIPCQRFFGEPGQTPLHPQREGRDPLLF